jgi:maltose O-acetyltransferase
VTTYSLALKLVYLFTDFSPGFLRMPVFRVMFRRLGKRCLIDRDAFFRYPSSISIGDEVSINRGYSF